MAISATCPCGARFTAQPHLAGKTVNCPTCRQPFQIPVPPSSTFSVACPCGRTYPVQRSMAGRLVQCNACGQQFVIPGAPGRPQPAPARFASASVGPTPFSSGGPLDNLGNFPAHTLPSLPVSSIPLPTYSLPASAAPAARRRNTAPVNYSLLITVALSLLVCCAIAGIGVVGWKYWPSSFRLFAGYGTPEAAFAAMKQAQIDQDWRTMFRTLSPESRTRMVRMLANLSQLGAGQDPEIGAILQKHGVEVIGPAPVFKTAAEAMAYSKRLQDHAADAPENISHPEAFFVELMEAIARRAETLQNKLGRNPFADAQADSKLLDVHIDGDTARGRQSATIQGAQVESTVEFRRVDGHWYIHLPEGGFFGV